MIAESATPFPRQAAANWTLRAAQICFAVAIVLLPIRSTLTLAPRPMASIPSGFTDFQFYPADAALLLMLVFWLASLMVAPRRPRFGPRAIWLPLAGLTLAGWLSAAVSVDPPLSVYHAIRLAVLFWFYVFVVNEVHSFAWVVIPAGVQAAGQSAVALAQFIAQRSVGLQWIGEYGLNPADSGVSVVVASGARLLRAYGLTDHPNILGGCLGFVALLLLFSYLREKRPWLALGALVLCAAALLATFSRSAWLALGAGSLFLVLTFLFQRSTTTWHRWLVLGAVALGVVLGFVSAYGPFLGVRFGAGSAFTTLTAEQQSLGERVLLMQSAAGMIWQHPLLGVGLGAAPRALQLYEPDWPVTFEPPHVAIIDAALETGLAGAAFYVVLLAAPWIVYFARPDLFRTVPSTPHVMALLLAILIVGLFDYYTWSSTAGTMWQWLAWGLWARAAIVPAPSKRILNVNPVA